MGDAKMDQPLTQRLKASEVRQHWSPLINKVFRGEVRVVVEKSGIPVAAIISVADLERLSQLESEREERFKPLQITWEAFKDVPPEQIEREVSRAVAEVRQKRRQEG
jgi:prevent-host-death family protein